MMTRHKTLYLLTCGDGSDGNEWVLLGLYSSKEFAKAAKKRYLSSDYHYQAKIEEWKLDKDTFFLKDNDIP